MIRLFNSATSEKPHPLLIRDGHTSHRSKNTLSSCTYSQTLRAAVQLRRPCGIQPEKPGFGPLEPLYPRRSEPESGCGPAGAAFNKIRPSCCQQSEDTNQLCPRLAEWRLNLAEPGRAGLPCASGHLLCHMRLPQARRHLQSQPNSEPRAAGLCSRRLGLRWEWSLGKRL